MAIAFQRDLGIAGIGGDEFRRPLFVVHAGQAEADGDLVAGNVEAGGAEGLATALSTAPRRWRCHASGPTGRLRLLRFPCRQRAPDAPGCHCRRRQRR
jgi:hypothetical protein